MAEMSRNEAEREEAEELIAWAADNAPDLLPSWDERDEPEAWTGVLDTIREARFTAARPAAPAREDSDTAGHEPEPF